MAYDKPGGYLNTNNDKTNKPLKERSPSTWPVGYTVTQVEELLKEKRKKESTLGKSK